MPRYLLLIALLTLATPLAAQPRSAPPRPETAGPVDGATLARDYARRGEWEKAVFLFEKLKSDEQTAPAVLPDYLAALLSLKRYKDAEKLVKRAIRQHPEDGTNGVALGGVLAASGDAPAADKQYGRMLSQLTPAQVAPVATEFSKRQLPA